MIWSFREAEKLQEVKRSFTLTKHLIYESIKFKYIFIDASWPGRRSDFNIYFFSFSLFKGIINCRAQKIDIIINDQLRFFDACGFFFLIERKATSHLFFQWLQIRRSHGATDK